jgi:hypothetical protein
MRKWFAVVAVLIMLAGVLMSVSRTIVEEVQSPTIVGYLTATEENSILVGSNITGYYEEDEALAVSFTHNIVSLPEPALLGFAIIEPNASETHFEVELYDYYGDIIIINVHVTQLGGNLDPDHSLIKSMSRFIARVTQGGNYTLVFRSEEWPNSLHELFLQKLTSSLVHPYSSLPPLEAPILIIGAILFIWSVKTSPKRKVMAPRKKYTHT